ncbi:MAG: FAD-dependent oxidoreductase, partial [Roseiflexaceae bacterium]
MTQTPITPTLAYDIAIIGGGLSAVAAALVACAAGKRVCIVESSHWLGGQCTSQGVSALDEHRYIESWPGNRYYAMFRRAVRKAMAARFGVTPPAIDAFNPGNAWVSNLCFLPDVARQVIDELLAPFVARGLLTILYESTLVHVDRVGPHIHAVVINNVQHQQRRISAHSYVDASDNGDVLALAQLANVTGAESHTDTGETHAPLDARPHEVQSFTYGFAVEYVPGSDNRIAKPEGYALLRDRQPFTLTLTGNAGEARPFRMFCDGPTGMPPFWTYRRLWDGSHTVPAGTDIALINWNSNDYHEQRIIDQHPADVAAAHDEAKRLSLSFLYWLQTEVPRDDGGYGYPELRLRPDVMGTADGLSCVPYVRESRRSPGLQRIVAEDILVAHQPFARARHCADSVGVGWYFMDLHPAPGNMTSMFAPTRPFQIPMGALIPPDCHNLLLANKTIATTHLSNGAYRLHPIEWQIGAAIACIALESLATDLHPAALYQQIAHREAIQRRVLASGQALAWSVDMPIEHPHFVATQWLLVWGIVADGERALRLEINPDLPLSDAELIRLRNVMEHRGYAGVFAH